MLLRRTSTSSKSRVQAASIIREVSASFPSAPILRADSRSSVERDWAQVEFLMTVR